MCDQPACYSALYRRDGQRFCAAYKRVPHPAYGNARIPAYEMTVSRSTLCVAALVAVLSVLLRA